MLAMGVVIFQDVCTYFGLYSLAGNSYSILTLCQAKCFSQKNLYKNLPNNHTKLELV